jgi:putative ABC transport system ATP-binding protein
MGFVFQTFALIPRLSVLDNIAYPLIPRRIPRSQRYEIARSLLERCGIANTISKSPEYLSVGEQQRVAMARALAGQPEVLLADEPTSNLDARSADLLLALLHDLHSHGNTVIVASHDRTLVSCATVLLELEIGRVKL